MTRVLTYIAAIFLSVIPFRYRKWWSEENAGFRGPAIISGIVQFLAFFLLSVLSYLDFFQRGVGRLGRLLIDKGAEEALIPEWVQWGMGFITSGEYLLHPTSILMAYLMFEGIFRTLAALISEQVLPTLPLAAIAFSHHRIDRWRAERALGPLIPDEVQLGDGSDFDLRVLSCRPKSDWNRYITVEFKDVFYQMFKEEEGPPPRRFIYYLRKSPIGRLVVVIRHYGPADVG